MKPDFALDFRDNQISLLHRADGVWATIGRVAMDDPDLDAAMGYLRATALGLSPRGIATKLILPNDAILYTQLSDLPFDAAKRAQRIAEGLVGRTPYDVADLVYDWTDAGDSAHVAVIARETLAEAEGFASQHRFNPISFAALPDQGGYEGEVWFGATQLSETLLAKGEVVERDEVTVFAPIPDVAGQAPLEASDFEMGAGAADMAETQAVPAEIAAPAPESPEPVSPEPVSPEPESEAAPAEHMGDKGDPAPMDDAPEAAASADAREVWQDFVAQDAPPMPSQPDLFAAGNAQETAAADDAAPLSFAAVMDSVRADDAAEDLAESSAATSSVDQVDEAPMAVDVPLLDEPASLDAPAEAALKKPSKADLLLSAFAARRAAAQARAEVAANTPARSAPVVTAPMAGADTGADEVTPSEGKAGAVIAGAPKLGGATAGLGVAAPITAPPITAPPITAPPITAPSIARPPVVKHVPAKTAPNKGQNLKSMPKPKAKGGIKLGWVLTIALLLALMVAAALSTYLLESANKLFSSPTAVASVEVAPPADITAALPNPPAAAPIAPAIAPEPASTLTLATRTESSAVSVPSLPATVRSSARPAPRPAAAPQILALPKLVELPVPVLATVPTGTDTANLVPTDLAAAFQASPTLVPAPRPQAVLDAARLAAPPAAPAAPIFADPALANARPLARPETVTAQALASQPAATIAATEIAVNANPALQGARPLPRPAGVVDLARAAQLASAPASLLASAAIDASEAALLAGTPAPLARPDPNRSKLAVAISPAPATRPKGLKAAFEAQQAAAAARAAEAAEAEAIAAAVASAAAAAPAPAAAAPAASDDVAALEAEVEEEVTRADGGATRSIVAKQATLKNALNLSQANLVGIFGSKANRYALIRQPSGTFKKLKVGDRFDGGRVAAITESELRYDKGGELLALTMPRG